MLRPPVEPMLAQAAEVVPGPAAVRAAVAYEQKLDGSPDIRRRLTTYDPDLLVWRFGLGGPRWRSRGDNGRCCHGDEGDDTWSRQWFRSLLRWLGEP